VDYTTPRGVSAFAAVPEVGIEIDDAIEIAVKVDI
jgi:hypothetical protein